MMCEWLHKYTERCIISFVDQYRGCPFVEPEQEEIVRLAEKLGAIAKTYNLPIYTCAEAVDLTRMAFTGCSMIERRSRGLPDILWM